MFASRRQSRNHGNSRGAMNNPTSSQPTSWDAALDEGSDTEYDDGEAEYRQPLTPVEEDNRRLPDDFVARLSPGRSRENGRRTRNPNSTTPGVYQSQLLTRSPGGGRRNRGESDQRQRREEAVRVFCPPEGETTRRSRGGGWSEDRQEREAALKQIGAHIEVLEVTQNYELKRGGRPCDQPLKVLEKLKWVAFNFKRELPGHRITKIEFIRNDRLYERFRKTKEEFRRLGKTTKEMLLYHGTRPENVKRIITGGFMVGGRKGHQASHGQAWGAGIYCCMTGKFPVQNFNDGNNRLICMRALPGDESRGILMDQAGKIDSGEYDSYFGQRDGVSTYVIRRPCQTLPCYLIYYQ